MNAETEYTDSDIEMLREMSIAPEEKQSGWWAALGIALIVAAATLVIWCFAQGLDNL